MIRTPLIRRIVALGLLGFLIFATWSWLPGPALDAIAESRAHIAGTRALLQRYDALAMEAPVLEHRLQELRGRAAATGFLVGPSVVLAAAKLQTELQQLAATSGIAFRTSETLPPKSEASYTRVGLEVEFGATPETLSRLIHGIESANPALLIDHLTIHAPETSGPGGMPLLDQPLTVRLSLYGYVRGTPS
jgi:hypothetical protein